MNQLMTSLLGGDGQFYPNVSTVLYSVCKNVLEQYTVQYVCSKVYLVIFSK